MSKELKAYNGPNKYIFVSYAHKDKDIVYPFIEALQKRFNVWFDDGIHLGKNYKEEIMNHVLGCELFLFMVSPNSIESKFCQREIYFAEEKDKNFINIFIENFNPPDSFIFDYGLLQNLKLFEYSSFDEAIDALIRKAKGWIEGAKKDEEIIKEEFSFNPLPISLLDEEMPTSFNDKIDNEKYVEDINVRIYKLLREQLIDAKIVKTSIGLCFTRIEIVCNAKKDLINLEKSIVLIEERIVKVRFAKTSEKNKCFIEYQNLKLRYYSFKTAYKCLPNVERHPLSVGLGMSFNNRFIWNDYDEFPHLLVTGEPGSGKTMYIHSLLCSLLMRIPPSYLKLIIIDFKRIEFKHYKDSPHLLLPIFNELDKALNVISSLSKIILDRFELFEKEECTNIKQYNELMLDNNKEPLPYILTVIDEFNQFIKYNKRVNSSLSFILKAGRAAGIHILLSSYFPDDSIITNELKENITTRIAFRASNKKESTTIVNEAGAEKLIGHGDMLILNPLISRDGLTRLQAPIISSKEIQRIVDYLKDKYNVSYDESLFEEINNIDEEIENRIEKLEEKNYQLVKEWVMSQEYVSLSKIQREFGFGFNRAGKYFRQLVKDGIVEPNPTDNKGCKVIK